jgi:ferredoxin-NADP reductase
MAQAKIATVVDARTLGPDTRMLELEVPPLGFVGGQYLFVNPGVLLPNVKPAKRAYSIVSADERQDRVTFVVKRLETGPASTFLHTAPIGASFEFSGPWGKYLPDDARPRRTLVVATDTGITAALGLVRGKAFAPQRPHAELLWLVESNAYFLPEAFVREASTIRLRMEPVPPVGHPERVATADGWLRTVLDGAPLPESVFLSGDGALLHPLRDRLAQAGVPQGAIRLESFFNNPERKAT